MISSSSVKILRRKNYVSTSVHNNTFKFQLVKLLTPVKGLINCRPTKSEGAMTE